MKNQKGAISLFVLLAMMFFLVFMLGAYTLISRRNNSQIEALSETQKIYAGSKTANETYDSVFKTAGTSIVPITNLEQLQRAKLASEDTSGSTTYKIYINGKVYTYKYGTNYVLQNDIILDFEDTINGKNNLNSILYDYVLYNSTYNINLNGHSIYYQMNDGSMWKLLWYQNVSNTSNVFSSTVGSSNYYGKSYGQSTFSILEDGILSNSYYWGNTSSYEFLLAYNTGNSNNFDITNNKLYNRWRQGMNPIKENRITNSDSAVASGYTHNFSVGKGSNILYGQALLAGYNGSALTYTSSATYSYWGGLQRSVNASKCYLDGSIGNAGSYFQIAVSTLTNNKIPVTTTTSATEGLLFVRTQPNKVLENKGPIDDSNYLCQALNADKYGWIVTGYLANDYKGVWRLFYQDANNTYIIADPTEEKYLPSSYYSGYANGSSVSEQGKNLNSKLDKDTYFSSSNENPNIRAVAWLTDTNNSSIWSTKYKDSSGVADYAIGSPTLELYVASFKATHSTSNASLSVGNYGYECTELIETNGVGSSEGFHGIYNFAKSASGNRWWIASPRDSSNSDIWYVNGANLRISKRNVTENDITVRPIVCIPTSKFNSTFINGLINDTAYLGEARNSNKYGWKVNGYTSKNYNGEWRLFYQDDSYTYIIAEPTDENYNPSSCYSAYPNGLAVSEQGKNLNNELKYRNFFKQENTNQNIRMLAWITDTSSSSIWSTKYKDAGGVAEYAIGSPSIELYVASFKATHSNSEAEVKARLYGYSCGELCETDTNHIGLTTEFNGIYHYATEGDKSKWWLASPNEYNEKHSWYVRGDLGFLNDGHVEYDSNTTRPIVAIPTNVFNNTLLNGLTNDIVIGNAINTEKYGWKVNGYTAKEYNGNWRLFYQDASNTYIIADQSEDYYDLTSYYSSTATGADISDVGRGLNRKISSLFTSSNTNSNIKATVWFTDTSNTSIWSTKYKDSQGKASFAIGAPTGELYEASYNATHPNSQVNIVMGSRGYGYTPEVLAYNGDNKGIYGSENICWLASPNDLEDFGPTPGGQIEYYDGGEGQMCVISSNSGTAARGRINMMSFRIRPIVCFTTSVFNENYTLTNQ